MDVASLLLKDPSGLGDRGRREQALSKLKVPDSCRCCHCSVKLSVPTPLTQPCLAWLGTCLAVFMWKEMALLPAEMSRSKNTPWLVHKSF